MHIKETLHSLHLNDLKNSGLSDKTIIEANIKSVPPSEIIKKLEFNLPDIVSMYEIPYPNIKHSRFRVFYSEFKSSKKQPKYLQRKGTGGRLYIHHNLIEALNNPSITIYITEGEKKTLKAVQEGICCIGIAGLWCWGKNNNLIEDFKQIVFIDRKVGIVPDNDWLQPNKHGYQKNLREAVYGLANKLIERGAKPFIVQLPEQK